MSRLYTLELCIPEEVAELKKYLDTYWQKDHVLVQSKELFNWQYISNGYINWVIARNNNTNEIDGAMGFLPTYHYDKELTCEMEFWGALWSTNENAGPGLGMALMKYVWKRYNPTSYGALGISEIAKRIYKMLNQKMGYLNQYYYLNKRLPEYTIAQVKQRHGSDAVCNKNFSIHELHTLEGVELDHIYRPRKTIAYLINRYQKHPIYKYRFLGIYDRDELICIWIIRKPFVKESSCLRIIDIYGDLSKVDNLETQLDQLLRSEDSEYIDCLNFGIEESQFKSIGFRILDPEGEDIIPNYFEPFVKENIQIEFSIKSFSEDYVIFKGDGDLDRPSVID